MSMLNTIKHQLISRSAQGWQCYVVFALTLPSNPAIVSGLTGSAPGPP